MSFRNELAAAARRKSAWVTWTITAAVFFLLGHLAANGWHF